MRDYQKTISKGVMEEKAEMLRKYLKDIGDPLILWTYHGNF